MDMLRKSMILLLALTASIFTYAQNDYLETETESNEKIYQGGDTYEVKTYAHKFKTKKPKNVILLIGDGMSLPQLQAGLIANKGQLFIENFKYTGLMSTHSADNYITDSAAG